MKRLFMLVLAALISCLGAGCITRMAHEMPGESTLVQDLVTVPLDIVTSPVQLPFWLDYWASTAVDQHYERNCFDYRLKAARTALEKDFNVVIRNRDYLEKYDEDGFLRPGFIALTDYLSKSGNVQKLTRRQAEHLAFYALEHPGQFMDWPGIWETRKIGRDLRQRARKQLLRQHYEHGGVVQNILDSYCYTDDELVEIMRTSPNRSEVLAADAILWRRR